MKTLEVLDKVVKGKRLTRNSQSNIRYAMESLSRYSEELPDNGLTLNEWLNSLNNLADETVRLYFRMVRSCYYYVEKPLKVFNPFRAGDVISPKVERQKRRYWTAEEIIRIIKACETQYERLLIMTIFDSACRIGEIGCDVHDLTRHPGLYGKDIAKGYFTAHGKTGEATYRLDYRMCEELKKLAGGDGLPVFKRIDGKAADSTSLAYKVRRIVKRAGLTGKKLGPHTLRHSAAEFVALKTGSTMVVQALLQHEVQATSEIYIHDAGQKLVQGISPLELVGADVTGQGDAVETKALALRNEPVVVVDGEVIDGSDLTDEMFVKVPDGSGVRPLLKDSDLFLLRTVMVDFSREYQGDSRVYECQVLLKRMLRKAG